MGSLRVETLEIAEVALPRFGVEKRLIIDNEGLFEVWETWV